jgi:hypothetical protein
LVYRVREFIVAGRVSFEIAALAGVLAFGGCHSACFQTAKIRNGVDATAGVTRVTGAENSKVSDYSIFIRGEVGWAARRNRVGYGLGLTFVSPFRTRDRDIVGDESDSGTFPNETVGALPEFKIQAPRNLPVDLSLDARLNAIYPERIGLLASRDLPGGVTPYGAYFFNVDFGQVAVAGAEIEVGETVSLLAEYSQWLSRHDYPTDYRGRVKERPYSIGIAVSYHLLRTPKPYDPRRYAGYPRHGGVGEALAVPGDRSPPGAAGQDRDGTGP